MHAFARLYGLVRWFHPSDAAATVDWERFAIDGAHRVADAADRRALQARLAELIAPIAPTVHIIGPGEMFPDDVALHPASQAGLEVVAWQHKGYGDTTVATDYASKRTHREKVATLQGALFASLSQSIDATPLRGKKIRLRGKLRTAQHARGQLWLRVDRGDASGFFDNMQKRPVLSDSWTAAEIVGAVADDATRIVFGILEFSHGTVWYDDLELAVAGQDGTWRSIDLADGGFEAPELTDWQPGVGRSAPTPPNEGWHVSIDHESPASGRSALRVEPATRILKTDLFQQMPSPGETVEAELGSGLRVRVPIALYSKDGRTLGDDPDAARRAEAQRSPGSQSGFDVLSGTADIIVFWNVLEHFWPYWNTVSVDRDAALDATLTAALKDRNVDDHLATLERLSVVAPDGHVTLRCPSEAELAYAPFAVDLVESQVIVTNSEDPAIKRGDAIMSIDGKAAMQLMTAEQARISGSPQWRTVNALRSFGAGPLGSSSAVRLRRGSSELELTVQRIDHGVSEAPSRAAITRFDDGVYYVDLSRTTMADIDPIMDRLVSAPGVIFDIRRYPKRNYAVMSHILDGRDPPRGWELVPLIIRPDTGSTPEAWEDTSSWNMPRLSELKPHFVGRVAVLTGPEAISFAESVMALVEYYHVGEIVGAPTAGTNGDIAQITLPTGCNTLFTARRVIKPDGRQHHLVGIQPTIPASRTIAGVAAGRDEVLERGLAYVRTGRH